MKASSGSAISAKVVTAARRRFARVLAFSLSLVACGGAFEAAPGDAGTPPSSDGGGGGGGDGGSKDAASDGTTDPLSSECPASIPSQNTACAIDALECEYGTDPRILCNTVATCTASGWKIAAPTGGATCPSRSAVTCPASFAGAALGGACSPRAANCFYAKGRCTCGSSLPVAGEEHWTCDMPAAGCPSVRPFLGSTCTSTSTCDYGSCNGGNTEDCVDGAWRNVSEVACPG